MKEINKILGQGVTKRRADLNMTREKLAEIIDVSPRFLADVESGKVGVSIQTLKSLANALCTSADYLLGITIDMAPDKLAPFVDKMKDLDEKYYQTIYSLVKSLSDLS